MAVYNARISLPTPGLRRGCRTRNPFSDFFHLPPFFFCFFRLFPLSLVSIFSPFGIFFLQLRQRRHYPETKVETRSRKTRRFVVNQSSRCKRSFLSPISRRLSVLDTREKQREGKGETKVKRSKGRDSEKARNGGRLSEQEFDNYVTGT